MERHTAESFPIVDIRVLESPEALKGAAELVRQHSWGADYPLSPASEIERAEYRIGAYANDKLVGFASVGRSFSPDGQDNDALWLAHAVVVPELRQQGLFQKLYAQQIAFALSQTDRILSCTDNPVIETFFLNHDWQKVRDTQDEAGDPCGVYEYTRP